MADTLAAKANDRQMREKRIMRNILRLLAEEELITLEEEIKGARLIQAGATTC